ncbi:MAG: SOS response-associated peptidase [Candidatus Sumerlaeia bacterium]|nr:SOS response-associated peptidase [Candidatus Sumerlaeia bacterium]
MCGRYSLALDPDDIMSHYGVIVDGVVYTRRYNIAPGQQCTVLLDDPPGGRTAGSFRWGLVPSWAKDPSIANKLVNARSETAAEKPSFRDAFRKRRCIVLADGFYEWGKAMMDGRKIPIRFERRDGAPLSLAGLWESWTPQGSATPLLTFTILTTAANDTMRPYHHRMPVLLEPANYTQWIDSAFNNVDRLMELTTPAPNDLLSAREVSTRLNSVANDDPSVLDPPRDENSFL